MQQIRSSIASQADTHNVASCNCLTKSGSARAPNFSAVRTSARACGNCLSEKYVCAAQIRLRIICAARSRCEIGDRFFGLPQCPVRVAAVAQCVHQIGTLLECNGVILNRPLKISRKLVAIPSKL